MSLLSALYGLFVKFSLHYDAGMHAVDRIHLFVCTCVDVHVRECIDTYKHTFDESVYIDVCVCVC